MIETPAPLCSCCAQGEFCWGDLARGEGDAPCLHASDYPWVPLGVGPAAIQRLAYRFTAESIKCPETCTSNNQVTLKMRG